MRNLFILLFAITLFSCNQKFEGPNLLTTVNKVESNFAADGFDSQHSDAKAIEIADLVMQASGGRKAWDAAKILKWNFFGARSLIWNKQSGDIRINMADGDVYISNIFESTGTALIKGQEIVDPDSLAIFLNDAKSIWINDSYWLFLPYKLKDSGVTLKYLEVDTAKGGAASHVLELTFANVGDTPENKYHVWVDTATNLINQWSFYANYSDTLSRFTTPWADYNEYGNLNLSGNRGNYLITEIEVLGTIDLETFTKF
jgi:hypothetical protein